jgi:quercetin dioxygenase-like cupin family protein
VEGVIASKPEGWRRDDRSMPAFEFDGVVVTLHGGTSTVVPTHEEEAVRVDGFTVGVVPHMERPPPHRGELHPDGDELLYLVSGRVEVVLDDGDLDDVGAETRHEVGPGQAFLVPRGVWHRIEVLEPAHLVHVTPGPGSGHRPLAAD